MPPVEPLAFGGFHESSFCEAFWMHRYNRPKARVAAVRAAGRRAPDGRCAVALAVGSLTKCLRLVG